MKQHPTHKEIMEKEYVSDHELAILFGTTVNTFQKWRSMGVGPSYIRLGRTIRYRLNDTIEWAKKQGFFQGKNHG